MQRRAFVATVAAGAASLAGCTRGDDGGAPGVAGETLTLATTTSTVDTGLLDAIHPGFEDRYGVTVDAVPRGTGAALETARNGDADVVLVHARGLEDEFLRDGHGVNRRDLMFNDFVVVGPADDPAGVRETTSATAAFTAIADAAAPFVSRGDDSGTHRKELALWSAADADPGGDWYREVGTGMGEALNVAAQQGAYTLSDHGTFLARRTETNLVVLLEGPIGGGPAALANPYGIMAVNPGVHERVDYDLAMAYIGWMTGPDAQAAIANYEVNGEQLFFPEAVAEEPDFRQYVPEGWSDGG